MTQSGVVTKILSNGKAEVSVERGTACGGNCSGGCEACVYANRIFVQADNLVYASVGDRVILESRTSTIMGATLLIYMLPLVFFFVGLAAASVSGCGQGFVAVISIGCAVLGAIVAVLVGRKKKDIRFRITGYER